MANNAEAITKLQEQIARVRAIPKLAKKAAPEVATEVGRMLEESARRGNDPDGEPWLRKITGGQPLTGAYRAISTRAVGSVVIISLTGKEVYHHTGATRGHVRRRIIPTRGIPGPVAESVKTVLSRRFGALMKEGDRG
jgi:hypothetical protein